MAASNESALMTRTVVGGRRGHHALPKRTLSVVARVAVISSDLVCPGVVLIMEGMMRL